jgi:hypothetical protein
VSPNNRVKKDDLSQSELEFVKEINDKEMSKRTRGQFKVHGKIVHFS